MLWCTWDRNGSFTEGITLTEVKNKNPIRKPKCFSTQENHHLWPKKIRTSTSSLTVNPVLFPFLLSLSSCLLSPSCVYWWSALLLPCGSSWTADSPTRSPLSFHFFPFFLHYSNKCVPFFLRHKAEREPWPQRAHISAHKQTHLHMTLFPFERCRIEVNITQKVKGWKRQFKGEIMVNQKRSEEHYRREAPLDDTPVFICTLTVSFVFCHVVRLSRQTNNKSIQRT